MANANNESNNQLLKYLLIFILGGATCWFVSSNADIKSQSQILYVSQDEIIEYENTRIKQEELEKRQMFFGKVEEAVRLATILPQQYENATTKVVYSAGLVSGSNVKSISKEVHQQIISRLSDAQVSKK